jgi:hypothetical protein
MGFPDPGTVVSLNDFEGKVVSSVFIPPSIMCISKPKLVSRLTVYIVNIQWENNCQQVPHRMPCWPFNIILMSFLIM